MNKTVGLDIVKLNLFFMKPNNLTSLRRMSRVRFAWDGFLRSNWPFCSRSWRIHTVLHPYSAVTHGKGFRQNPAVLPPLHSNTILKMQVKDNLFIDTNTLK